ncbi:MAG: peptidase M17 [Pseudonocardiaceae bacterium]|nr:peptidase M17 [Pseudonocardiaceae bacterium]
MAATEARTAKAPAAKPPGTRVPRRDAALPPVPTRLPTVELTAEPGRGVPRVVVAAAPAGKARNESADEDDGAGPRFGPAAGALPAGWLDEVRPSGKAAELHRVHGGGANVRWLLGVGDGSAADWRCAGAALIRRLDGHAEHEIEAGRRAARVVAVELPEEIEPEQLAGFVLGLRLGGYRFVVSQDRPQQHTSEIRLVRAQPAGLDELPATIGYASELAAASSLARDLANAPSNVKNPDWLARTAVRTVHGVPGLHAEVHDERWLTEHRFGGTLAVGGGSASPPRLVELSWRPRGATEHLVLVGKGITFDTGGLSVKPADGMHLMRTDMSGGAAVIAALRGIAALRLPIRVTGLVPCAENHISGSAYRPGDVLRQYGGTTTEITNTDAEGRLVLADALAYAAHRLKPDVMVDVATLTGAMKVSLGLRTGGLFSADEALAEQIRTAGERVGEAWWRMPLLDDHADAVRGELGDVRQCPPGPGGITAALFLREFTDDLSWAHLDIAGPARAERAYDEVVSGATGFAARTLIEFAVNRREATR